MSSLLKECTRAGHAKNEVFVKCAHCLQRDGVSVPLWLHKAIVAPLCKHKFKFSSLLDSLLAGFLSMT